MLVLPFTYRGRHIRCTWLLLLVFVSLSHIRAQNEPTRLVTVESPDFTFDPAAVDHLSSDSKHRLVLFTDANVISYAGPSSIVFDRSERLFVPWSGERTPHDVKAAMQASQDLFQLGTEANVQLRHWFRRASQDLVTSNRGLFLKDRDRLEKLSFLEGLDDLPLDATYLDTSGRLWFCISNALFRANETGHVDHIGVLPARGLSIAALPNEHITVSTAGKSLWVLENEQLKSLRIPGGRIPDTVYHILVRGNKVAMVGAQNELIIWDWNDLTIQRRQLGLNNGRPRLAHIDHWNNLWLVTNDGLFKRTMADWAGSDAPPTVWLADMRSGNRPLHIDDVSQPIRLHPGDNYLQCTIGGVHLSRPTALRYQWTLDPTSETWSEPSTRSQIHLPTLGAGHHRFQARATIDGQVYGYTETVDLIVGDTSYQRYLWIALGVVGLLLLLALLRQSRLHQQLRNLESEREKWRLEKDALKFQQRALQLQMNPHFVFNAIQSIQGLIALDKKQAAKQYLTTFAQLMRDTLAHGRSEWIALDDEIRSLRQYLQIEQLCRDDRFDFDIRVADDVDGSEQVPPMLIQPFIENAIVHGFRGLKHKGHIQIDVKPHSHGLYCTIEDNGIGRQAANQHRSTHHRSVALEVIQERLSALSNARETYDYSISDLFDNHGQARGTRVDIHLPIFTS